MTTLHDALDAAGLIDGVTGLPLPSDRGRDNFPVQLAMFCELATEPELAVMRPRFIAYLEAARVPGYRGLFKREQGNDDFNGVCNYIGIVRFCQILMLTSYIAEIYLRGLNYDWTFDNQNPEFKFVAELSKNHGREYLGRALGFPIYVKWAATGGLSLWDAVKWTQAEEISAPTPGSLFDKLHDRTDVGNDVLNWHEVKGMVSAPWYIRPTNALWRKRKALKYPGGLAEMLGFYWKPISTSWQVTLATGQITEATKEHPFVVAAKGRGF